MVFAEQAPNSVFSSDCQQLRVYAIYSEEDAPFRQQLGRIVEPLVRRGLCSYSDRSQMSAGTAQAE